MHGKSAIQIFAFLTGGCVLVHSQTTPNSVDIRTFSTTYDAPKLVRNYKDGLGRKLATFTAEGTGDIVAGTILDPYGRPFREVKPYYSANYAHAWPVVGFNIVADANGYYNGSTSERPNSQNFAYKETQFSADPLGRTRGIGLPGQAFSLYGSYSKVWYLGVATPNFLPTSSLTDAYLDAYPTGNYAYFLEVTKDPDGNYRQTIKDKFERVLKTWADPKTSGSTDKIVDEKVYDYLGNLVKCYTPGPGSSPDPAMYSTFTFGTDGKIVSETHPDEGTTDVIYDRAGRVRFTQDAKQKAQTRTNTEYHFTKYDILGRDVVSGIINVPVSEVASLSDHANLNNPDFPQENATTVKIRKVYDDPQNLCSKLNLPQGYDSGLRNLKGRLAGIVSYGEFGSNAENRVGEIYSYNGNGTMEFKYVFVPSLPVQYIYYHYDLQNRLRYKYIYYIPADGYITGPAVIENVYDENGRLSGIKYNADWAVLYSYTKTGLLSKKDYWKDLNSIAHQTFTYNIHDALSFTQGNRTNTALYQEELNYETVGTFPKYDGTISRARHKYFLPGGSQPEYILNYKYDGTNRLIEVQNTGIEGEIFTYDVKGRINTSKQANPRPLYGPFVYASNTNQVTRIPGHPSRANANGNFVYDPNGNMVFDRSKKMAITYDWRNMPVRYRMFTSVPDRVISWTEVEGLGSIRSEVEMMYDAAGNRVLKRTSRYN